MSHYGRQGEERPVRFHLLLSSCRRTMEIAAVHPLTEVANVNVSCVVLPGTCASSQSYLEQSLSFFFPVSRRDFRPTCTRSKNGSAHISVHSLSFSVTEDTYEDIFSVLLVPLAPSLSTGWNGIDKILHATSSGLDAGNKERNGGNEEEFSVLSVKRPTRSTEYERHDDGG